MALEQTIAGLAALSPATGTDDETVRNRLRLAKAANEGRGQLDNTLIVFTSEEGYFYGEHGLSFERCPGV